MRRLAIGSLIAIVCLSIVGLSHAKAVSAAGPGVDGSTVQVAAMMADVAAGKKIYDANCASCHGAKGMGGVGPSLHGTLKNPAMPRTQKALVAWIKNPKPPMPKLYPAPLSDKDVDNVAGYVLATFK